MQIFYQKLIARFSGRTFIYFMRIPLVLLFLVQFCLLATASDGQSMRSTRIDLDAQNISIKTAFTQIETRTGFSINYNASLLDVDKAVHFTFHNEPVNVILQKLLEGYQGKISQVDETHIFIDVTKQAAPAKTKKVNNGKLRGKVVDERGLTLPGARIKIVETGETSVSAADGTYTFDIAPGTYTVEVSYLAYQTKRITGVIVKADQTTPLDIALEPDARNLKEVVVTASYKKATINALYVQQKNAAGMTDGISAEQISRTPDRHVGESLARITGVSTTEGKRVVVRGIAERYNVSTLNGSTLPSTDVQERDFEFDLIPTNLVDQIVVAKTITPDMPYSFAGGLVQITTKAIPTENFTGFNAGVSYNDRTIGKDFLSYRRGKYDYLGFDDGARQHFPKNLLLLQGSYNPTIPDGQSSATAAQVAEQNKRIGGTERLGTRAYAPMPSQNYQFTMGRVYNLGGKEKVRNLGFVASLSYRNTQRNNYIANMRRGGWSLRPTNADDPEDVNTGNQYMFNTSLGVMVNAGLNTEHHQFQTYNLYTRIFDNLFNRIKGWSWENPKGETTLFPGIEENERPKFTDLLQNKIAGKHVFGRFKLDWNASRTYLKQAEQDASSANLGSKEYANYAPLYLYYPSQISDPGWGSLYRGQLIYRETNKDAMINGSYSFNIAGSTQIVKAGYNYQGKHATYDWTILPIGVSSYGSTNYQDIPLQDWGNYMDMKDPRKSLYYNPSKYSAAGFEGKTLTHGSYLMLDNKLGNKLRLVWGARAEYFKLDTIINPSSRLGDANTKLLLQDKAWRFLPSANITYTPVTDLNFRLAYAKSAVRPGLMENSRFSRYDFNYGTNVTSQGVITTVIDNYDAKLEWFPGAGEILSVGYFYKYFDKPAEFYRMNNTSSGTPYVFLGNSDWAKVRGWEFDLRKSLGFVHEETSLLKDIYLRGNLTLQKSEVQARELTFDKSSSGQDSTYFKYLKYPRQLYGQVPLLYNLGAEYAGKRLGITLMYNYMGYKTFATGSEPMLAEYERPRGQMDLQISYRFYNNKMQVRLNGGNLTDAPHRFFINDASTYEIKPGTEHKLNLEWNDKYEYKFGFTEKFEKGYTDKQTKQLIGDRETFTRYVGRTYSISLSYNF